MENKTKMCGVYAIRNLTNGKMYIGSTITSFHKRWQTHRKRLKNNTHHSNHLQKAYNKYGKDNFEYQILEITTPEIARIREGYYIAKYKTLNSTFGYNTEIVNLDGCTKCAEKTKQKLSMIAKDQWKRGVHNNSHFKGKSSWNKGIKCDNISLARRQMFSSVEVYKNDVLIVTFRSIIDLSEWTKNNILPGLDFYTDKAKRSNKGTKTSYLQHANIGRAIRNKAVYRGLVFKRALPLPPEMGVAKWENCWEGEIPNQQPSQPLTKLEGSETNS